MGGHAWKTKRRGRSQTAKSDEEPPGDNITALQAQRASERRRQLGILQQKHLVDYGDDSGAPKKLPKGFTTPLLEVIEASIKERREAKQARGRSALHGKVSGDQDEDDGQADEEFEEQSEQEHVQDGDMSEPGEAPPFSKTARKNRVSEASDVSGDSEQDDYVRRPGRLSKSQLATIRARVAENRQWVDDMARTWEVNVGTITHEMGMHKKECRSTSYWNKHEKRMSVTAPRAAGESKKDYRARVSAAYHEATMGHKEPNEEDLEAMERWEQELDLWWDTHHAETVAEQIRDGDRYKMMIQAREEFTERAQYFADSWQIITCGLITTSAADDHLAQAASCVWTGSNLVRGFWDLRNTSTKDLLGDLRTMALGEDLKNREHDGVFHVGKYVRTNANRDARKKENSLSLLALYNNAFNENLRAAPWNNLGPSMKTHKKCLENWPVGVPHPLSPQVMEDIKGKAVNILYNVFHPRTEAEFAKMPRYVDWNQADQDLESGDEDSGWNNIPLVVNAKHRVLVRVGDLHDLAGRRKDFLDNKISEKAQVRGTASQRAQTEDPAKPSSINAEDDYPSEHRDPRHRETSTTPTPLSGTSTKRSATVPITPPSREPAPGVDHLSMAQSKRLYSGGKQPPTKRQRQAILPSTPGSGMHYDGPPFPQDGPFPPSDVDESVAERTGLTQNKGKARVDDGRRNIPLQAGFNQAPSAGAGSDRRLWGTALHSTVASDIRLAAPGVVNVQPSSGPPMEFAASQSLPSTSNNGGNTTATLPGRGPWAPGLYQAHHTQAPAVAPFLHHGSMAGGGLAQPRPVRHHPVVFMAPRSRRTSPMPTTHGGGTPFLQHDNSGIRVQPGSSVRSRPPSAMMPSRPTSSVSVHPIPSMSVRPSTSMSVHPGASMPVRPGSSIHVRPSSSIRVRPSSSMHVRSGPSLPVRPTSSMQVQPAMSTMFSTSSINHGQTMGENAELRYEAEAWLPAEQQYTHDYYQEGASGRLEVGSDSWKDGYDAMVQCGMVDGNQEVAHASVEYLNAEGELLDVELTDGDAYVMQTDQGSGQLASILEYSYEY